MSLSLKRSLFSPQRLGAWFAVFFVLMLAWLAAAPLTAQAEEEFLDPEQAFVLTAAMSQPDQLDIHFQIAPEYYMYRKRFEFSTEKAEHLGTPQFPDGEKVYDPTFDEVMEVYRSSVTLRVPVLVDSSIGQDLKIDVVSQGCADAGLCYSPSTQTLTLIPTGQGWEVAGQFGVVSVPAPGEGSAQQTGVAKTASVNPNAGGMASALSLSDVGLADYLKQAGWGQIVLLSFVFGLLLSFTPCVLPMVPILLSIIAGRNQPAPSRWHGLKMAFVFVLGLSLVYTLLGVAAGLLGAGLASWLQNPWVLGLFALILVALALSMLDVFTLQAPAGLQTRLNERMNRLPGGQLGGVFLMGMLSALIVGPCVAAPLAGVLLFISQTGDVVLGGSALFALAWGSGVLLLVVGAGSGSLLPKAGAWMESVKTAFGVLLLATAWWMVSPLMSGTIAVFGWVVLALWAAALLGAFGRGTAPRTPWSGLRQGVGVLLAVWAIMMLISIALARPSVIRPLEGLKSTGTVAAAHSKVEFQRVLTLQELDERLAKATRPVMLDFYADWCVSCIEMENFTFSDPAVAQRMAQFELLQVDVTANTPEDRELLKHFRLFGPPGIMFFDSKGKQLEQLRVIGFQDAARFSKVLDEVLAGA
ncbi:thiol:disulfide interchange protein DsbD [Alcaligenes pakistanensis]|uniref:Thiol:disulfide interchange protein DsbD n=1 Tax=Alcaligenes pakistanensis TaxID=1482717 RepID=A0A8H9M884_9BURK|nr:protein-disulfide reductase DsbD [Alcaligenes pakistanensis]GHC51989.1 thiol:disulfide interchange protein DsbD [Alcaligenes pakistanensis]